MHQLENLYRQIIMDHYKNPRHKGLTDDKNYFTHHIKNPSCGDDITIQTRIENQTIKDVRHDGSGCSICCSSASVLASLMIGKDIDHAEKLTLNYLSMIMNRPFDEDLDLDDAMAYQGVKQFPARIKCATIAWKAFENTIKEWSESHE